ncbi:MAG: hypothetical protein LZF86_110168 [Nitrospira sp.]|nr:MAG: hypothetical protein LZF86_110168 [Nitrospira sp.]
MADIYGTPNDDVLNGTPSNDYMAGDYGNDVYNGGAGNDVMQDWGGSDTYLFGVGSGQDTVQDWGWEPADIDTVQITNGVMPASLFIIQDWATNNGALTLRLAQSDDQMVIGNTIEQIRFADGTVWDAAAIQAHSGPLIVGNQSNDFLYGTQVGDYMQGLQGDDTLNGYDGNDALLGGSGNDQLLGGWGDDTYNGGVGNDVMQDAGGSDTYLFGVGSGQDTVQDWGWEPAEIDTVQVSSAVASTNLLITQDWMTSSGALTLRLAQSDDQMVIGNSIEQIQFADGTRWDAAAMQARVQQVQMGIASSDYLSGGWPNNYLDGGAGDDFLQGSAGIDTLLGGAGNDQLSGGAGNDVYNGGAGNDLLQDWGGSDTYLFGAGSGQDTVQDGGWGPTDIDTVQIMNGVTPASLLVTQDWATNPGGLTLRLAQSDDQLVIQSGSAIEQIQFADGTRWDAAAMQARVQQVQIGTANNDYLSGGWPNNYLDGGAGDDFLQGSAGIDTLLGGAGNDQLSGGVGNDVYNGGAGNDAMQDWGDSDTYLFGVGSGQDTVQDWGWEPAEIDTVQIMDGVMPSSLFITQDWVTSNGALTLRLAQSDDQMVIGNTIEQIRFADGTVWDAAAMQARVQQSQIGTEGIDYLWGSDASNYLQGLGGNDHLNGNEGDDVLLGGADDDSLNGGQGNDMLNGGAGVDQMWGGSGNDTYLVDDASDAVVEVYGEGNDIVRASVSYALAPEAEVETIVLTGSAAINATGSASDNTLVGNVGDNILDGGLGHDTMQGGAGNDSYIVGELGDVVVEQVNEGSDTVQSVLAGYTLGANIENLTLLGLASDGIGNSLNNIVIGNSLNNLLDGREGNDTLDGGAGADQMWGGAGDDSYIIDNAGDAVSEGGERRNRPGSVIGDVWIGGQR